MIAYRRDIDGLRALAVVPVILFHADEGLMPGGFVGVDVFFVISGFLITSLLLKDMHAGTYSLLQFYERRIRRIFPALFVMVAGTCMAGTAILMPAELEGLGKSVVSTTLFASNILFWREAGYFDVASHLKPLLHTWSLAVEEQFYIFFPPFLWCVHRWAREMIVGPLALGLVASLAISIYGVHHWPDATFYLPASRAWELLIGALLAAGAFPVATKASTRNILGLLGLALIAYANFSYDSETPFPGINSIAPSLGTALVIHAGTGGTALVNRLLGHRSLVHIGLLSYSLYLWHWPIFVLGGYVLIREPGAIEISVALAATWLCGYASWRYVEQPFRTKSRELTRTKIFVLAAIAMLVSVAIGYILYASRGLPQRLPDAALRLANAPRLHDLSAEACREGTLELFPGHRRACNTGAPDHPLRYAIWGDSHAESMTAAIVESGTSLGMSGLYASKPSCPPLLEVLPSYASAGVLGASCTVFNHEIARRLAALPDLEHVILIGRWSLYIEGERTGREGGATIYVNDADSRENSLAENHRVMAAGMRRTVDFLRGHGLTVHIVAGVPEIGLEVPSVLARARFMQRDIDIRPTRAALQSRQGRADAILGRLADDPAVDLIEPRRVLCDDAYCEVVAPGDHPLYFDTNHLTQRGAARLRPQFAAALARAPLRP